MRAATEEEPRKILHSNIFNYYRYIHYVNVHHMSVHNNNFKR